MRFDPGDIVLRPGAGAHVASAFAHARALAVLCAHDVMVEGNGVCVVVTPQMSDAQCRRAYEFALAQHEALQRKR